MENRKTEGTDPATEQQQNRQLPIKELRLIFQEYLEKGKRCLQNEENERAFEYFSECMKIAGRVAGVSDCVEDKKNRIVAYIAYAYIHWLEGPLSRTNAYFGKALRSSKQLLQQAVSVKEKKELSDFFYEIGKGLRSFSEYQAEQYFELCLELRQGVADETQEFDDKIGLASCYESLAFIARGHEQYQECIGHYKKLLQLLLSVRQQIEPELLVRYYFLLGSAYRHSGDSRAEKDCCIKALELRDDVHDEAVFIPVEARLGTIYFNENQYDKAEDHLHRALSVCQKKAKTTEKKSDLQNVAILYRKLAYLFDKKEDSQSAREYCEKSIEACFSSMEISRDERDVDELALSYSLLAETTDDGKEREYYQKAIDLWSELLRQHPNNNQYSMCMRYCQQQLDRNKKSTDETA